MNISTKVLCGHPYHDKSDSQLRYILRDPHEAAKAMKDHDPVAEAKYLDQLNDATTILEARRHYQKAA